ncbi:hypothetical protein BP6252_03621 [Coleophoma cylindrospora]|uniref:SWR1-complex protein 3 domain-containing protein n=1 Tax=Coleophoma cylindrospora TaxID=1849047 RepID=A0A3D8S865_9HELO|nr:hypothetical protein BP6252_03621 [Coleophoma cylindrospora]
MESRKRKLPGRAARADSENKKKRTSTPPEPSPKATTPVPIPAPVVEPVLPKSITAGKPLPTVDQPQPQNLSYKDYQSISESGVLQESLIRSRAKWISEGIFERYWTKPSKKKSEKELQNNPGKDTMTKLGSCTITIEPHVFDATMYAIKDPTSKQALPPMPQQPMYRPIIQYGPPNGVMPPSQPHPPPASSPPQQYPTTQQGPPRHDAPVKTGTPGPNTPQQPRPYNQPNGNNTSGAHQNGVAQPTQPAPAPYAPAPAPKGTDPVIQMLAERAATDADLKALMRIVANGEATPEELKKFQGHIDELTRLTQARQAAAQQQAQQQAMHSTPRQSTSHQPHNQNHVHPTSLKMSSTMTHGQPQALRSKGGLLPSKSDISGIVFDFAGGSGDRFMFPKFSILEYLPQGQVIASFLLVRKGSKSDSPNYDPKLDYHQPITIRLHTHQGRQLDSLARVVANQDEVRRYMDDIMDNTTRAEYVLLAMQLPKDKESVPAEESKEGTPAVEDKNNGVLWTASPNPVSVTKMRPMKAMVTEEEQYKSFISSVSAAVV